MVAYERKPVKKILAELAKKVGSFTDTRLTLQLDKSLSMEMFVERLKLNPPLNLGGAPVWRIDQTDGFKFIMKDGSWLGLRPAGIGELTVRLYAEAATQQKIAALNEAGRKIVSGKF
jgi:phosphomannomutase